MLAAFGTIGGALFGFDVRHVYYYLDNIYIYIYHTNEGISSMSAWIGADQYMDYFNSPDSDLQGGVCTFIFPHYIYPRD